MLKLLRVDLAKHDFHLEEMPQDYQKLGGRALSSMIISKEVSPDVDALDPSNKLIFAAGILAGTGFANSSRLSVGSKSPLTGGIKEANAGGNAASKLAKLGIQAVVFEGAAAEATVLKIDKNGATFFDAGSLKGLGNYQVIDQTKKEHGEKITVISIGPAGEKMLKTACVSVTSPDFQPRLAARGGLGAVMGSKNLKAVIIDSQDAKTVEIKDKTAFKKSAAKFAKGVLAYPMIEALNAFGTPVLVNMINGLGCLPTRNYSIGQFDGAQAISGEHMAELMAKRPNAKAGHKCMSGCIIGCSNVFTDEKGELLVSGLEYESIVMTGSNCMIDDIDIIAKINWACNDIGVDTMDVGAAIGLGMENGLLPMGDGNAALALVNEIREGTANGLMIGSGCKVTGEKLGAKRIPHVKGQSLAAYDPRGLKGTGTTYATSAMGADHTVGNAIPNPLSQYDPASPEGQWQMSSFLQIYHAAIDSLGICLFASLPALDFADLQGHIVQSVAALYGEPMDNDYLMKLGVAVLAAEKQFNKDAGFTKEDDRLPDFFKSEPLLPSGNVFDVPDEDLDKVNNF